MADLRTRLGIGSRRDGSCRVWIRALDGVGFGIIWYRGRTHGAHRMAWMLARGLDTMPDGLMIIHSCENRACIEPAHLKDTLDTVHHRAYTGGWVRRRQHHQPMTIGMVVKH